MSEVAMQQAEAVKELRGVIETVGENYKSLDEKVQALDGLDKEKFEKCNAALDSIEKKNQELTLEQEKSKKESAEFKEQIENLEKQVVQKSIEDPNGYKNCEEVKAFNYLLAHELNVENAKNSSDCPEELKTYMRTDVGTQGGYTVPKTLDDQIQKEIIEKTPALQLVRVRTMPGVKSLQVLVESGKPTSYWVGEAESVTESDTDYRLVELTARALGVKTRITRDLLNFSKFNIESEVTARTVEEFTREIGRVILLGNAQQNPQGILDSSAGVTAVDSETGGELSFDDVINIIGQLKVGYNGVFGFNRRTLVKLRTEKDSNGNYLWRFGAEGMPNQIVDFPYIIMQDMPDIAVGNKPVIFGDFLRGYTVLDAMGMEATRDQLTLADQRMVVFNWFRFLDGKVTVPEAFKLINIKA